MEDCVPDEITDTPSTKSCSSRISKRTWYIFCVVYLDDILIYLRSIGHRRHVRKVLERLRRYRLYAKLSKSSFDVDTVNFPGYVPRSQDVGDSERNKVMCGNNTNLA